MARTRKSKADTKESQKIKAKKNSTNNVIYGHFCLPSGLDFSTLKSSLEGGCRVVLKDISRSKLMNPVDRKLYFDEIPKLKPMPLSKKINKGKMAFLVELQKIKIKTTITDARNREKMKPTEQLLTYDVEQLMTSLIVQIRKEESEKKSSESRSLPCLTDLEDFNLDPVVSPILPAAATATACIDPDQNNDPAYRPNYSLSKDILDFNDKLPSDTIIDNWNDLLDENLFLNSSEVSKTIEEEVQLINQNECLPILTIPQLKNTPMQNVNSKEVNVDEVLRQNLRERKKKSKSKKTTNGEKKEKSKMEELLSYKPSMDLSLDDDSISLYSLNCSRLETPTPSEMYAAHQTTNPNNVNIVPKFKRRNLYQKTAPVASGLQKQNPTLFPVRQPTATVTATTATKSGPLTLYNRNASHTPWVGQMVSTITVRNDLMNQDIPTVKNKKMPYQQYYNKDPYPSTAYRNGNNHVQGVSLPPVTNCLPDMELSDSDSSLTKVVVIREPTYLELVKNLLDKADEYSSLAGHLKKNLCNDWLSNNFICRIPQCKLMHNVEKHFAKVLPNHNMPAIMRCVIAMRQDVLFVEAATEALNIICKKKDTKNLKLIVFLVFYLTEPSDHKMLPFWNAAMRTFIEIYRLQDPSDAYVMLMEIVKDIDDLNRYKVYEFIKLLRNPPISRTLSYKLLSPVLHLNLPQPFLLDAVKDATDTRVDTRKVYEEIVPKISFEHLRPNEVEVLVKFCESLSVSGDHLCATALLQRIKSKFPHVQSALLQNSAPASLSSQLLNYVPTNSSPWTAAANPNTRLLSNQGYYLLPIDSPAANQNKRQIAKNDKNHSLNENVHIELFDTFKENFKKGDYLACGNYLNRFSNVMIPLLSIDLTNKLSATTIKPQQVVDCIGKLLAILSNKQAIDMLANIGVTLIDVFGKRNDWGTAYAILKIVETMPINFANVRCPANFSQAPLSQFKIISLLVEVYIKNDQFQSAITLVEKYRLVFPNPHYWTLKVDEKDIQPCILMIEEILQKSIVKNHYLTALNFFGRLIETQKAFPTRGAVDLKKFSNEIVVQLLNNKQQNVMQWLDKMEGFIMLKRNTVRALVIAMVRSQELDRARGLVKAHGKTVYHIPSVAGNRILIRLKSCWLEEEVFMIFDVLFEELSTEMFKQSSKSDIGLSVVLEGQNYLPDSFVHYSPMESAKHSLDDIRTRLQKVLGHQLKPRVEMVVTPKLINIEISSLMQHLLFRAEKKGILDIRKYVTGV